MDPNQLSIAIVIAGTTWNFLFCFKPPLADFSGSCSRIQAISSLVEISAEYPELRNRRQNRDLLFPGCELECTPCPKHTRVINSA